MEQYIQSYNSVPTYGWGGLVKGIIKGGKTLAKSNAAKTVLKKGAKTTGYATLAGAGVVGAGAALGGVKKNLEIRDTANIVKYTGKGYNMGSLTRKHGEYYDANGQQVTRNGLLTKDAWNYLASKYGKDYANRTSLNTSNGNIYDSKHGWRPDIKGSNKLLSWDEAMQHMTPQQLKDFKDVYSSAAVKYDGQKGKVLLEKLKSGWNNNVSIAGNAVLGIGRALGLNIGDNTADLAGTAAYFIPGVGTALAVGDAVDSWRKGDFWGGLANAAFAIPGIGGVGKALKGASKLTKSAKALNTASKTANEVSTGLKATEKAVPLAKGVTGGLAARSAMAFADAAKFGSAAKYAHNPLFRTGRALERFGNNKWTRYGIGVGGGVGINLGQGVGLLSDPLQEKLDALNARKADIDTATGELNDIYGYGNEDYNGFDQILASLAPLLYAQSQRNGGIISLSTPHPDFFKVGGKIIRKGY